MMGQKVFCLSLVIFLLISENTICARNDQKRCHLKPADESLAKYMDDPRITLNEFYFKMGNYSVDPFQNGTDKNYKMWRWHRTRTQHGRTLLMLSFNYDVLSLSILTIGVKPSDVLLQDVPFGCYANVSMEEKTEMITRLILNDFYVTQKSSSDLEYESHTGRVVFACNSVVKQQHGYAEFVNRCCHLESDGTLKCTDQAEDSWITLLYVCITFVKVMILLFGPLLIPSQMYDLTYMASTYVIKLENAIKMKLFITENPLVSQPFKKRLTLNDIPEWKKFKKSLKEYPTEEVIPVKMNELRIEVKGKRIIPENDPPTGLLKTIFDNIIRCKIKALDPFHDCCDRSVYAKFESRFNHTCTWHMLVKVLIRLIVVCLIPIPLYVRIFLYYKFEEKEIIGRREFLKSLNLYEHYDFYRTSVMQYLSPTHGLFITAYVFCFLSFCSVGITTKNISEKVMSIVRGSLQDMLNVKRTGVLQVLLRISLWPFKHWGMFAFIVAPFYACVMIPACSVIFTIYCFPTVYLTYRLYYHARLKVHNNESMTDVEQPVERARERNVNMDKLRKNITQIDRKVHRKLLNYSEEGDQMLTQRTSSFDNVQQIITQLFVGTFCVACLYSVIFLTVESIGVFVEIISFTMMGVIVNAGSTLRYVSMVLLVLVYMHECYSQVYESYLTFNKAVIEDIMDRVEDLKKVASLPSSMQENIGFTVKPVEAVDQIPTTIALNKAEPTLKIGHLLLFLDSYDTPRIPLRLFKKLCEVTVHGAPGPVYINLLCATGKFFIIVIFLLFVMIVVMAFGNVHQISSTNQTLATLAGGFVPMLLKNILPRKSIKLNLKTISFKGQIDEVICEFKQNWPIRDLVVEKDEPAVETEESETKKNDDSEDLDPSQKKNESQNKDKEGSKLSLLEKYMKENAERKSKFKSKEDISDSKSNYSFHDDIQEDNVVDFLIDLSANENFTARERQDSANSLDSTSMIPDIWIDNTEFEKMDRKLYTL